MMYILFKYLVAATKVQNPIPDNYSKSFQFPPIAPTLPKFPSHNPCSPRGFLARKLKGARASAKTRSTDKSTIYTANQAIHLKVKIVDLMKHLLQQLDYL